MKGTNYLLSQGVWVGGGGGEICFPFLINTFQKGVGRKANRKSQVLSIIAHINEIYPVFLIYNTDC